MRKMGGEQEAARAGPRSWLRLIVWTTGKAHLGRSLVVFAGSQLKSPRNDLAEGLRLVMTIRLAGGSSGSMPACCMHASG